MWEVRNPAARLGVLGYDGQLCGRSGVSSGFGGLWHRLPCAKLDPGDVTESPDRREAEAESQAKS